jgi:hypothetical protein
VLIDEQRQIIAGHGRVAAAKAAGDQGGPHREAGAPQRG